MGRGFCNVRSNPKLEVVFGGQRTKPGSRSRSRAVNQTNKEGRPTLRNRDKMVVWL
jgi:hypothetical protein